MQALEAGTITTSTLSTPMSKLLPPLCALLELASETSVLGGSLANNSIGWSSSAVIVSQVLYYAFPLVLAFGLAAALLGFVVVSKMANASHECYLAAFHACSVAQLLVAIVQALPGYLLSRQRQPDDASRSNVAAALSSAAPYAAALSDWFRVACAWLLVVAALQRAMVTIFSRSRGCEAEQLPPSSADSRASRLRGTAVAVLTCMAALVSVLPRFWMFEVVAFKTGGGSGGCTNAGMLQRRASLTREFVTYDWYALFVRVVVPYILLPIMLPPLSDCCPARGQLPMTSKQHSTSATPQRDGRDFNRLLLMTTLLYLLLAAPASAVRLITEPPAEVAFQPDPLLLSMVLALSDVLFNSFYPIAFILHLLCSSKFRETLSCLCCCCRRGKLLVAD